MSPQSSDNRASSTDSLHAIEEDTAIAAQRIVATYAEDFLDYTTLTSMLGVEPEGLIYRRVAAEYEEKNKEAKKSSRKSTKKSTKKTTKKSSAKKTTKKTTKKSTKKTTKKSSAKKTSKKTASSED